MNVRLSSPDAIAEAVRELPRPLLLAFDVDGTLAPIVDRPEAARVPDELQRELRRLARAEGITVAVLTGRDQRALTRMLRVPGAYRGFEHGRVIVAPGERPNAPQPTRAERARLADFERWVKDEAAPAGAELEQKRASRVLHVRELAKRDPRRAESLLAQAKRVAKAAGLHVRPGRAVLEAELIPGDKGAALRTLYRKTRARGVVYCGDDVTDIPALRAATELGGIGIFVRSAERPRKPSGVRCSVPGTSDIEALVRAIR